MFEVRGQKRQSRAALFPPAFPGDRTVILQYRGLDQVTRTTQISFSFTI
ncbi:glycogen debranching N-terminal domain-containing protein [Dyadobacter sp. LHD-138]